MQMVSSDTLCKITTRSVASTTTAAKGSRKQVLEIRRLRHSSNTEVDRYSRVVSFCSRHEYANLRVCSPTRPHTLTDYFLFGFSLFGVGASRFHSSRSSVLCFLNLFSCLLCVLCGVNTRPFWSSYLSVFAHFRLHCPHQYIFMCISLHISMPSQSRFYYGLTYVFRACPRCYLFCPGLLNPLYNHDPSHYSHPTRSNRCRNIRLSSLLV